MEFLILDKYDMKHKRSSMSETNMLCDKPPVQFISELCFNLPRDRAHDLQYLPLPDKRQTREIQKEPTKTNFNPGLRQSEKEKNISGISRWVNINCSLNRKCSSCAVCKNCWQAKINKIYRRSGGICLHFY